MNEKTLTTQTVKRLTFKGRFKGRASNFIPKVVSKRFTITDAFHGRFKTTITVYIPKINPKYVELQTMLHMVNGAGSCQLRVKDPRELANQLEEIVKVLRSDDWLDKAFRVEDIAEHIKNTGGELPLAIDEDIIDINSFKESMLDTIDVDRVDVEDVAKEFLREKGISEASK